jgi:hypothetical protein
MCFQKRRELLHVSAEQAFLLLVDSWGANSRAGGGRFSCSMTAPLSGPSEQANENRCLLSPFY